jgi:hypothetical protein
MSAWMVPERFAIYGLPQSSWSGPRWLSLADEGEEGRGGFIMVDHGRDPWLFSRSEPWVSVGSSDDAVATTDHDLARLGLILLLGSNEQPHYSPFNLGSLRWVGKNRLKPLLDGFDSWESVTWQIDGEPKSARITRFTSALVGVATVKPDAVVLVVACGIEPEGFRLETQTDTSQYHFDRKEPVTDDTWDRARRSAFGDAMIDVGPPIDLQVETDLIPDTT